MVPKSTFNTTRRAFVDKNSLYPPTTSVYKPLSSYLRGAVDMDSTETRANGSPKYDVIPSSSEFGVNNIDPFADPRNSIFDIVAECSDPAAVESIRQSLAGDASIVESDSETE